MAGRLIAVEAIHGDWFVDQIRQIWADGDAVFPLDPRLPMPAREHQLARFEPSSLRSVDGGETSLDPSTPIDEGDALVISTSGTDGEPKGVVLTHDALHASATMTSERLAIEPATDRWLACIPLAHVGGFSVVSRSLITGTPLSLGTRPSRQVIDDALEEGATRCALVPAALHDVDVDGFTTVLLGGSHIPTDRPENCIATYGSTETGSGIVYDGVPLDGVGIRVIDGQLSVRTPSLARAYRDGSAVADADGWYATGDAGVVRDDGTVDVHGRVGDVIVSGGEKVWPSVVERRIAEHPTVCEVAVVGRPDSRWGAAVTAVVVVEWGEKLPSLATVREWVKETLPAYAAPRGVEFVDALPRLPGGKVDRRRL